MTQKLTPWDPADHWQTDADVARYIEACIEEDPGDGSLIQAGLADVARARGLERLAIDTGLAAAVLEQALTPGAGAPFAVVMRVVGALGIRLHAEVA
jgi:probable addiction module antidote protein